MMPRREPSVAPPSSFRAFKAGRAPRQRVLAIPRHLKRPPGSPPLPPPPPPPPPPSHIVSAARGAIVRATASFESSVIAELPSGTRVLASSERSRISGRGQRLSSSSPSQQPEPLLAPEPIERVRLTDPIGGWVSRRVLAPCDGASPEGARERARSALLRAMARARACTVDARGGNPIDTCSEATAALLRLLRSEFGDGPGGGGPALAAALGGCRWPPLQVNGAFRRTPASAPRAWWWPPGFDDWAFHSFLVFEPAGLGAADAAAAAAAAAGDALPPGGLLVDVTADQFDARLPRLWLLLPSDASRHARTSARAHAAADVRQRMRALFARHEADDHYSRLQMLSLERGAEKGRRAKAARDAVLPDLLAAGAAARDFARAQGGGVCVRRLWPWPAPASVARENDDINFIEAK